MFHNNYEVVTVSIVTGVLQLVFSFEINFQKCFFPLALISGDLFQLFCVCTSIEPAMYVPGASKLFDLFECFFQTSDYQTEMGINELKTIMVYGRLIISKVI
jgi:hypothetical protein